MADPDSLAVKFKINDQNRLISVPKALLSRLDSLKEYLCGIEKDFIGKHLSLTWIDEEGDEVLAKSDSELEAAVKKQIADPKSKAVKFTVTATTPTLEPSSQKITTSLGKTSDSSAFMEDPPIESVKVPENGPQAPDCTHRVEGKFPQKPKKPTTSGKEDRGSMLAVSASTEKESNEFDSSYRYCVTFKGADAVVSTEQEITKTWCIRNSGPSAWPSGCVLKPMGNLSGFVVMGEEKFVPLPSLASGQETRVSVNLRAPKTPGQAKTIRFRVATRDNIEFGQEFIFKFIVEAKESQEENSTEDNVEESELKLSYRSVNFDDGAVVSSLQKVKKTWSLRNVGQSAWPSGCVLKPSSKPSGFVVADRSKSVSIPELAPNQERNISVFLQVPKAPGNATITFRAFTKDQRMFGPPINLKVIVQPKKKESTANEILPSGETYDRLIDSQSVQAGTPGFAYRYSKAIKDNTVVLPGQEIEKIWCVCNTGKFAWPRGCVLKVSDNPSGFIMAGKRNFLELPHLAPGKETFISVKLRVPDSLGPATIFFNVETKDQKAFGDLYVKVIVEPQEEELPQEAFLSPDDAFNLQWKFELNKLAEIGVTDLDRQVLVTLMQKHFELPSILRNNIVDENRLNSLINELFN